MLKVRTQCDSYDCGVWYSGWTSGKWHQLVSCPSWGWLDQWLPVLLSWHPRLLCVAAVTSLRHDHHQHATMPSGSASDQADCLSVCKAYGESRAELLRVPGAGGRTRRSWTRWATMMWGACASRWPRSGSWWSCPSGTPSCSKPSASSPPRASCSMAPPAQVHSLSRMVECLGLQATLVETHRGQAPQGHPALPRPRLRCSVCAARLPGCLDLHVVLLDSCPAACRGVRLERRLMAGGCSRPQRGLNGWMER